MGFGDKNLVTGTIDDTVVSNNNDSEKVLATVIATLYAFTDKHKGAFIYATGSTNSRTRLYRMGISKYLDEALKDFEIYGELEDSWELFKLGKDYNSFLVKRRLSMKPTEINFKKKPIIKIDKSLDFFNDKPLFPEKLEKANDMLKRIGLPKPQKTANKK